MTISSIESKIHKLSRIEKLLTSYRQRHSDEIKAMDEKPYSVAVDPKIKRFIVQDLTLVKMLSRATRELMCEFQMEERWINRMNALGIPVNKEFHGLIQDGIKNIIDRRLSHAVWVQSAAFLFEDLNIKFSSDELKTALSIPDKDWELITSFDESESAGGASIWNYL